jgi:hypothetical protein
VFTIKGLFIFIDGTLLLWRFFFPIFFVLKSFINVSDLFYLLSFAHMF